MHNFTHRPDPSQHPTQLQIVRCQPGKPLIAVITSDDAIGAYTHYDQGRTKPCTHPDCDPCNRNHTPRWYGYLGVIATATKNAALFEITAACAEALDTYAAEFGTLRGAQIQLTRSNRKANSRLQIVLTPSPYKGDHLPPAPDIIAHLCRIWEIRTEPEHTKQTRYRNRLATEKTNRAPTPN